MLVALSSIVSFNSEPIHTETIDKIEYETVIKRSLDSRGRANAAIQIVGRR